MPKMALSVVVTNGQGRFQAPRLEGAHFVCDLLCAPLRRYAIQTSKDLILWKDSQIVTNTLENKLAVVSITNDVTGANALFYRSRLLP
jgi:hypothetical protein